MLMLGTWEVGRMVEVSQILNNAVREGGRSASTGQYTNSQVQTNRLELPEERRIASDVGHGHGHRPDQSGHRFHGGDGNGPVAGHGQHSVHGGPLVGGHAGDQQQHDAQGHDDLLFEQRPELSARTSACPRRIESRAVGGAAMLRIVSRPLASDVAQRNDDPSSMTVNPSAAMRDRDPASASCARLAPGARGRSRAGRRGRRGGAVRRSWRRPWC